MSAPRRRGNSDAEKPIRFRVVSPEVTALYSMPRTDRPVEMLGNLPAHMLDGATLYVGGATSVRPGGRSVEATVWPDIRRK